MKALGPSRRLLGGPKAKRKLLEARRKRTLTRTENLAMLLPVATWKIKNVPNELDDPDKEMCRQTVQSAN